MVGIINYGMGNLRSLQNAFEYLDISSKVVNSLPELGSCDRLVLPGVGSYAQAMHNLQLSKLDSLVLSAANDGMPILGICLGMQLFSLLGNEPYSVNGLNLLDGEVVKLKTSEYLPHVGWNNVCIQFLHPVLKGVRKDVDFYFVHSYAYHKTNHSIATTKYGVEFSSIVGRDNVIGVQFHPEKSQENGLKILENFSNWNGKC